MFNFFSKNHIRYGIIALACSFLSSITIKNTQAELAISSIEATDFLHVTALENENEENELWNEVERMISLDNYFSNNYDIDIHSAGIFTDNLLIEEDDIDMFTNEYSN